MDSSLNDMLSPLDRFYRDSGAPLPELRALAGADVPSPQHDLLVHERDMTSVLEAYTGQVLRLEVLASRLEDDCLHREVVLVGEQTATPIEFGAIRIFLEHLDNEPARAQVLAGHRPLGGILLEHEVPYHCRPAGFFAVQSDELMRATLGIDHEGVLYGRHNLLYGPAETLLAEVTEILPELQSDGRAGP